MSRRACPYRCRRVAQELSVDGVGEASFETAQRFSVALAGGALSSVVATPLGVTGDLRDGHGMQTTVELAVTGAGESMPGEVTGGCRDRCGAGVGGERG